MAAKMGHLDVCKFIIERVENKNPSDNDGKTPLHMAAEYGRLEICQLIIKNIEDKNPVDNSGRTPKKMAQLKRFGEIVQLFDTDPAQSAKIQGCTIL